MLSRMLATSGAFCRHATRHKPSGSFTPLRHFRRPSGANGGRRGSPVHPEDGGFVTPSHPPAKAKDLLAPAVFTAGFCGATFVGCCVWQYENMRTSAKAGWKTQRDQIQVRKCQGQVNEN